MAWFTLESIFVLLRDSFPWDMLGIKLYRFYRFFLIFIVSILLDHCYCTLHIPYWCSLHCICFTFEITHLLPLQRDVLFKTWTSFNRKKKNEVDLHGWAFFASHLQISDRSLWRARIDFSRRTQDCDHHDPWHGRFKKEGHVTMSRLARVIASEVEILLCSAAVV